MQSEAVRTHTVPAGERVGFCSRCGALFAAQSPSLRPKRVCEECGMGVMLSCGRDVLSPGAAFLVVGSDGRITAVSTAAEALLGPEQGLVGKGVRALFKSNSEDLFARKLGRAAAGVHEVVELPLRANGVEHQDFRGVISSCSSPRAALLVIEPAL